MLKLYSPIQFINLPTKPSQRIIFFANFPHVNLSEASLIFKNADTIIFSYCDQNFINDWLNPNFFPNLKTVYMNSWCKNEIYRFNNITVYVPMKIYDNNIVCGHWQKSSTFIKIIDDEHFRVLEQLTDRNVINRE